MQVLRVFPRRTAQTPDDDLALVGGQMPLGLPEVDEVHVSVSFTWDLAEGERLARAYERVAPVKIGGPATGERGGDFTPGLYLKTGNVITSRGCPGRCWFCAVPEREGPVRELPIAEGWNLQDDNLLACSENHIREVFAMLKRQRKQAHFTGGLEAGRLRAWHVELLRDLKPKQMFFAYDRPQELKALQRAGRILLDSGFTRASHGLRCYVLVGHEGDTQEAAAKRLRQAMEAGFLPMAMLYRDEQGQRNPEWASFQRQYARPAMMAKEYKSFA